jgi:ribosomal protein L44E
VNYLKIYFALVDKALARPQNKQALKVIYGKIDRHHILPQCVGGKDEGNIVLLTLKEHRLAHLLLAKADPKNIKFVKAAFFMAHKNGQKMNAKTYEQLRTTYVDSITGVPKTPQHRVKIGLGNCGKKLTDAHRKNISIGRTGCTVSEVANKARSERLLLEYANGKTPPMLGKRHSEVTKQGFTDRLLTEYATGERISPFADPVIWQKAQETIKLNTANGRVRKKRQPVTEESRELFRRAKLEHDEAVRLRCPKCGKEGPKANMIQHHFDNCGVKKFWITNGESQKLVTLEEAKAHFQNGFRFGTKTKKMCK